MRHTDHRGQLEVQVGTKECDLPTDELARIQEPIDRIARAVEELPTRLEIKVVYHPRSDRYHVEATARLPRRSVFTGDWDPHLDTALDRSLRKLLCRIEAYKKEPDRDQDERAQRVQEMNRAIVAPEDPDSGPLAEAAEAQDYAKFRRLMANYEDWLRLRIGRWLQRYPEANAEVGGRLRIGDLVEEVFLNAFEHYAARPAVKSLHAWLDDLLDPSLRTFWDHLVEERESVSVARSLRDLPVS
jgi:hypothetical protein